MRERAINAQNAGETLVCHPTELCDLATSIGYTAWDPERFLICNLSIDAYRDVAGPFEQRGARELKRFRPIALLSHRHKLYCRCLLLEIQGRVDGAFGQEQTGYRRARQASETVFCALCITELSREWREGYVMAKHILAIPLCGVVREMMEALS